MSDTNYDMFNSPVNRVGGAHGQFSIKITESGKNQLSKQTTNAKRKLSQLSGEPTSNIVGGESVSNALKTGAKKLRAATSDVSPPQKRAREGRRGAKRGATRRKKKQIKRKKKVQRRKKKPGPKKRRKKTSTKQKNRKGVSKTLGPARRKAKKKKKKKTRGKGKRRTLKTVFD